MPRPEFSALLGAQTLQAPLCPARFAKLCLGNPCRLLWAGEGLRSPVRLGGCLSAEAAPSEMLCHAAQGQLLPESFLVFSPHLWNCPFTQHEDASTSWTAPPAGEVPRSPPPDPIPVSPETLPLVTCISPITAESCVCAMPCHLVSKAVSS